MGLVYILKSQQVRLQAMFKPALLEVSLQVQKACVQETCTAFRLGQGPVILRPSPVFKYLHLFSYHTT